MASFGAVQSAASKIFAAARASKSMTLREEAPDEEWMSVADNLMKASNSIPAAAKRNLQILANIGVQYAPIHTATAPPSRLAGVAASPPLPYNASGWGAGAPGE